MKKQVPDRYAAELLQMVARPSLELVALKRHWPEVQRKFDKERRQLDRKIPEDDPIRMTLATSRDELCKELGLLAKRFFKIVIRTE